MRAKLRARCRAEAERWAAMGFGTIPSPRKTPVHEGWPGLALRTPEDVRAHWDVFGSLSGPNVLLTLLGFVVLDFDPRNGGLESLAKLEAKYGPLPTTRVHGTPRDGLHYVFTHDGTTPVKNGELDPVLYPGVDVKTGRGGLIPSAGSVTKHGAYTERSDAEVAPCPSWVYQIRASSGGAAKPSGTPAPPRTHDGPMGSAYGRKLVRGVCADLAGVTSGRNDALNNAAVRIGHFVGSGHVNEDYALTELMNASRANKYIAKDGYAAAEATARSGLNKGKTEPLDPPARSAKTGAVERVQREVEDAETDRVGVQESGPVAGADGAEDADENPTMGDAPGAKSSGIEIQDGQQLIRDLARAVNDGAVPGLYSVGDGLVHLRRVYDPELPAGETRAAMESVDSLRLGNLVAHHLRLYVVERDDRGKPIREKDKQPAQVVFKQVLASPSWSLPPLRGVTRTPILRQDGTVLNEPGYDPASGMYFDPMCAFDPVPDRPSRGEVERAFNHVYHEVLGGFPYVGQADRANAFAYATHVVGRRFLEGMSGGGVQPTPGVNVVAGSQGTGKSYLASVPVWVFGGDVTDYRPDEQELGKLVVSTLHDKRGPVAILDNVPDGYIVKNTTLASFLTQAVPTARLLGQTKNVAMINDVFWGLTGNGTRQSDDLRRRFFDVRLDAGMADPAMREDFALGDLKAHFGDVRNRAKFVWCCLVLWRAWVAAGANEGSCRMRGSYGWWSKPTAGLLEFLGVGGFMDNYAPGGSAEAERWEPFLMAWRAKYDSTRLKVSQLMRDHVDNGDADGWGGSFILPVNVNDYKAVREAGDILASKVDKVWPCGLVLRKSKRAGSNTYRVEHVNG
ncbi:bifunctional DNA primase/polymerase [Nocardiopsis dassonvillei]|uniref:bifunctional DNA primase/polymerase n=1 Tax=Nocardiopsis TaxID=2013 RepID=UPI0015BB5117|nr:bifunctional DNA primase/polymerase [Nocardiopsis flavescens]